MRNSYVDVLVVGAGLAGCTLGLLMRRVGKSAITAEDGLANQLLLPAPQKVVHLNETQYPATSTWP